MSLIRFSLTTTLGLLLVGCSSVPYAQRLNERQAAYEAAAGAPVSNFMFSSLYQWQPLSETSLVVYTRPTEAWLLNLAGCHDLLYVNNIGLTSNLGQVSARFDKVLTGRSDVPCTISQIRPVDVEAVRAAKLQQKRTIKSEPRNSGPPSSAP